MSNKFRLGATYALFAALALIALACGGSNSSNNPGGPNSGMNLAGNWTIRTVSTLGQANLSGTTDVTQSGQGVGINGSTMLTAPLGSIVVSQSGTTLTGTLTNLMKGVSYNFTGTLSGGVITIAGSATCGSGPGAGTQSASVTGTITSTTMQGNYTITRSGCYYPGDAGTWTATKQ